MLKRSKYNPVITRKDIPQISTALTDVTSVFNPGAVVHNGKIMLMLRVQNRARETFLLTAQSGDGIKFSINEEPVYFEGIENVKERIYHIYDPRITKINDAYYIMFAMDMDGHCELGLGVTHDFEKYEFLGIVSDNDNRNGVLFPEKINDKYLRLERPNKIKLKSGVTTGGAIVISESDDMINWKEHGELFKGKLHYWDEMIGAGPPPVKTEQGWLLIYHGIATHLNNFIYQTGVALLDLYDPSKVIARGKYNILEPRELYELTGQVPNVVFPSGMVVTDYDENGFAKNDARVLIYYGAADTVVCLAETTIADLLKECMKDV